MPFNYTIGASQAAKSGRVFDLADQLVRVSSTNFAESIGNEITGLRNWRSRIAVVGQVKAGKSTFINAFIGRPGFIPADVNPWTAAVTNLHFAHPDDPTKGGVFHFFSEAEWKRLYEGDTEARKMAEELLPGFKSSILHQQVLEMRERARRRLGKLYHHLHGTAHSFDDITPERLARYVCTGHHSDDANDDNAQVGRYSDITRSADIYQEPGIFACPAVVIDTPGVNDPFLVRDELTCQHLRVADIYVVVLSIHQALSQVDQGLIRMLAANGAKNVIVFINRIDELDDAGPELMAIQNKIRETLSSTYEEVRMTILSGSALWGEIAHTDDMEAIEAALASEAAATRRAQIEGPLPDDKRDQLFVLSGVASVRETIDYIVDYGIGDRLIRDTSAALSNVITASKSIARNKIAELKATIARSGEAVEVAKSAREKLEMQRNRLNQAAQDVGNLVEQSHQGVEAAREAFLKRLDENLSQTVSRFLTEQITELANTMRYSRSKKVWKLETSTIQERLEIAVVDEYGLGRRRMDEVILEATAESGRLLRRLVTEGSIAIDMDGMPNYDIVPIAPAISPSLSMELTSRHRWMFWKHTTISEDQAIENLQKIIRAEIKPIVEQFRITAEQAARERGEAALRRFTGILNGVFEALNEQIVSSEEEVIELEANDASAKLAEITARHTRSLEDMNTRMAGLDKVLIEFGKLLEGPAMARCAGGGA